MSSSPQGVQNGRFIALGRFTDAELFGAFCSAEFSKGVSNQDARFCLIDVGDEAVELHDLMDRLASISLASDDPLRLLRTCEDYLHRSKRQIQSIICAAGEYRSVANSLASLISRKPKIRV